MITASQGQNGPRKPRNWIRLRTLVFLRWWAIIGQIAALIVAQRLYNLNLEIGWCYVAIGASVITNLVATLIFPENRRLTEQETFLIVLFDMLQLGLMLYLTGGLHNPFSILIVGPVIVSASVLSLRSMTIIGALAIVIATLLIGVYLPLRTWQGFVLRVPNVFLYGTWVAIVVSVIFLGVYSRRVVFEMRAMSEALAATQMALAREQKLTDLGGVVAAAAHELGTPLATIKLTSSELAEELSDNEDLHEDAMLIREQADRCRDILRSMGRAGKEDLLLRHAPLSAVIEEAAEPHTDRGKIMHFEHMPMPGSTEAQPEILRRPEVIHGLRNLIQNGVDFAQENVWVESTWDSRKITIRIMDDGQGIPQNLLGRIGDPLMRRRGSRHDPRRPEYEGMGLGLFIAKTLLERSGAELTFANGRHAFRRDQSKAARSGALVELTWSRKALEPSRAEMRKALGRNQPIAS